MHEALLVPVLCIAVRHCYGRRRIIDRVQNARIRELCGAMKGVDERIDKGVLRWFGDVERTNNDRFAKRVYVEKYAGSRLVGRPPKR